jgi:cytoskeletal protein CcmA (bactofilin family)
MLNPSPSNLIPGANPAAPMTRVGPSISIRGELRANEDVYVDGQVEGQVTLPGRTMVVCKGGTVRADVIADAITVAGTASGALRASSSVEIWDSASVEGQVVAPRISVAEGAQVKAMFDTKSADAALRVAKYRIEKAADR